MVGNSAFIQLIARLLWRWTFSAGAGDHLGAYRLNLEVSGDHVGSSLGPFWKSDEAMSGDMRWFSFLLGKHSREATFEA